ncbi:MAG TPA: ATP-binding protein [Ignavibacteriaceae bacterium]|nr:ATP-binding protein [Ignavibacteriaceae bacterium]
MAVIKRIIEKLKEYHFEFKHLTVLFIILFIFQFIVSFINKASIRGFLGETQEWYQQDSAERLANLTTTSLELLLETVKPKTKLNEEDAARTIQSFDIILSQQILQHNIEELCVLVTKGDKVYAIDDGRVLYYFLLEDAADIPVTEISHADAINLYSGLQNDMRSKEQIYTILSDKQTFHTFVPFVLRGEYIGALYIKNTPDFLFITNKIISGYDETSVIYLSLILLGLLAMYFISSYSVKERDEAQKELFQEHEINLKKQINYEKEMLFTKRIYHTHHKAEKVMGFIKEDLRQLAADNISEIKFRLNKYANFISRVIYDMKWYDPPLHTIRNQLFSTDLNEALRFTVRNIFLRTSSSSSSFKINLELDEKLPKVSVNEFVFWEIIEPIIQNSIDHSGVNNLVICVKSSYDDLQKKSFIIVSDNGKGISKELLEPDAEGVKKLFREDITTKQINLPNAGYGCYIAYEISKRCGWSIDAENIPEGGCRFIITINI